MKKIFIILIALLLCGCASQNEDEYAETRFLMDTVCSIKAGGDNAEFAVYAAFERISEISALTNYYSTDSEVSKINITSSGEEIKLSEDMANMLSVALDISRKSDGAFDITVAPLKDLWRISDGVHKPPSDLEISESLKKVGYKQLYLDEDNKTLIKHNDNCKIDLSGVAKGYAADCAADILKEHSCTYALIDLGGNIYVYGANPSRKDGKWVIGLQKPFAETGTYSQMLTLSQGAVVTAGCYQRYFKWEGNIYHHIIDPMTGHPTNNDVKGISIKAENALLADCLSTACMVLGEQKGRELSEKYGTEFFYEK